MTNINDEKNDMSKANELIKAAWKSESNTDYDEAILLASDALALEPNDWYINTSLGDFLREKGELEQAERYCKRAVELAPEILMAWESLALVHFHKSEYKKAVEYFLAAAKIEEKARTYTMMASAKFELEDYDGAIADSSRALELDSDWEEARQILSKSKAKSKPE